MENIKKAKLIGLNISSEHHEPNKRREHSEGGTAYCFYIEIDGKVFQFFADYRYGSCYSGYTSASWGNIQPEILECEALDYYDKTPVKDIFINIVNQKVQISIQETEYSYDATVEEIKSIDGEWIVRSTGDGGCQYYSSGTVDINQELFKK